MSSKRTLGVNAECLIFDNRDSAGFLSVSRTYDNNEKAKLYESQGREANRSTAHCAMMAGLPKEKMEMDSLFSEPSTEVYKSLIEHNPDAILLFSANGFILEANQAVSKIFGYSSEKVQGLHCQDFLAPDHTNLTNRQFAKTLQGIVCEYETQGVHKNGEIIYL